jgi:hypothetical protein
VYQQRYCALIDILGFSTHVLRTADDPDERVKVWGLLAGARVAGPHVVDESRKEYRFHAFSDTLVLSDVVSVEGLVAILEGSIRLADSFLQSGFLCRGAVTKGALYHDDRIVFGEALIRAHKLESRIAKFPRILLEDAVAADAYSAAEADRNLAAIANHHLYWSEDGLCDINVFSRISAVRTFLSHEKPMFRADTFPRDREPTPEEDEEFRRGHATGVRDFLISTRLNETDSRHLENIGWAIKRFNITVPISVDDPLNVQSK